jgi:hypothetical protein
MILSSACNVCGAGKLPPSARFCRTCGRAVRWTETASGRRRMAGGVGVLVVLLALVAVSLVALASTHMPGPTNVVALAPPTAAPRTWSFPTPPSVAAVPPITPPGTWSFPTPPSVAAAQPTNPTETVAADAPVRPGDIDLWTQPLAVYAGGPSADRLSVHGLRVGLAVAEVPAGLMGSVQADHLRDVGGDLCAVDDGHISEIHVRDPALLARLPIDGPSALFARFGDPEQTYLGDGPDLPTYQYPSRGIDVRWDAKAGRLAEVVLRRPATPDP